MSDAKIIGGEYKIPAGVLGNDHISATLPYSLGRTALYAILDSIYGTEASSGKILLPDYICISVPNVAARLGIEIINYHIENNYLPDMDSIRGKAKECKAIMLVSYFGMVNLDNTIELIRKEFPELKIIVDEVQNIYSMGRHSDYDYCFTSYRKWFYMPDGAEVICKEGRFAGFKVDSEGEYVKYKAAGNVLKNYADSIDDSVALELIDRAEDMMDKEYLYAGSLLSSQLYTTIDIEQVARVRKRNAAYLHKELTRLKVEHLYDAKAVPLFVPIRIDNRDAVRKALFAKGIFAPIHWPVENIELQGNNDLYKTELSLICDQRYDEEDMERIIKAIEDAI